MGVAHLFPLHILNQEMSDGAAQAVSQEPQAKRTPGDGVHVVKTEAPQAIPVKAEGAPVQPTPTAQRGGQREAPAKPKPQTAEGDKNDVAGAIRPRRAHPDLLYPSTLLSPVAPLPPLFASVARFIEIALRSKTYCNVPDIHGNVDPDGPTLELEFRLGVLRWQQHALSAARAEEWYMASKEDSTAPLPRFPGTVLSEAVVGMESVGPEDGGLPFLFEASIEAQDYDRLDLAARTAVLRSSNRQGIMETAVGQRMGGPQKEKGSAVDTHRQKGGFTLFESETNKEITHDVRDMLWARVRQDVLNVGADGEKARPVMKQTLRVVNISVPHGPYDLRLACSTEQELTEEALNSYVLRNPSTRIKERISAISGLCRLDLTKTEGEEYEALEAEVELMGVPELAKAYNYKLRTHDSGPFHAVVMHFLQTARCILRTAAGTWRLHTPHPDLLKT
ncbi:hypothetical protein KIPB_000533 [Kipferlia bialata]|uniref:mRNA 5'-phosphatase n=1 Tax=Kipferlia bialata TaxID=797122 RepID=A0A9K3CMH3_9EUKA|nr:hypothetical protein KIPB_000533 [Kipferlia bialata]|eukprot:g533.t1